MFDERLLSIDTTFLCQIEMSFKTIAITPPKHFPHARADPGFCDEERAKFGQIIYLYFMKKGDISKCSSKFEVRDVKAAPYSRNTDALVILFLGLFPLLQLCEIDALDTVTECDNFEQHF